MRRPGILLTIAIAWTGVVVGHIAAYLLTYPAQGLRHIHLTITGHSWLGLATASLIGLIPVIVLSVGSRAIRNESWSGAQLALLLAAIQVPAFASIEILERGGSVGKALSDPAVFVGLILQPLVAVIAAWTLELLRRVVRAIATLLRPARRVPPRAFPLTATDSAPPRTGLLVHAQGRAPPLPSCV